MIHTASQLAAHYVRQGWPVLPLHYIADTGECSCGGQGSNPKCKPGKHPFAKFAPNGSKSATTDGAAVRTWFERMPYNIGIATGAASGIFVLDRDDLDGGDCSLEQLEAIHGALPPTLKQKTGNGMHYLFKLPAGVDLSNSQKTLGAGLDTRGTGGYICAAPSIHVSGNVYKWVDCDLPTSDMLAEIPSWVIEKLQSKDSNTKPSVMSAILGSAGEFQWPDKISDGEGRESFLVKAAGHLRGKGNEQGMIERTLLDYNKLHNSPPLGDDVVLDRARRYQGFAVIDTLSVTDWPNPEPLTDQLRPVKPFDFHLLPSTLRPWVEDASERMGCAPDFVAVAAMVAAGSVLGNRIGMRPKGADAEWIEFPNLWGAVVGRPSVMKSPAIAQGLGPLRRLEDKARSSHDALFRQFEINQRQYEDDLADYRRQRRQKSPTGNNAAPVAPVEPIAKRYMVIDSTVEALGVVCKNNPHGVLTFRDELSGLISKLTEEGEETHRAFYLQAWNGNGSYSFDRIGRGSTYIPKLCLSLMGGIQPARLQGLISNTVRGGQQDDGLLARFQLIVYPDNDNEGYLDRVPQHQALKAVHDLFDYLDQLTPASIGAGCPIGSETPTIGFSADAQVRFACWYQSMQKHLKSAELHPAEESHFTKYRKLIPVLAMLLHITERRAGPIQSDSFDKAVDWQKYLHSHARRIYTLATNSGIQNAKLLASRINSGKLKDRFSVRDVYQMGWTGLAAPEDVKAATDILVDHNWLRAVEERGGGRPTIKYTINPKLGKGGK